MCEILEKLHEYIPATNVKEYYDLFDDGCLIEVEEEIFHRILFGGDQLGLEEVVSCGVTMSPV